MYEALLALVLFLSVVAVVWLMIRYSALLGLIDHPNARSSHSQPTPRGAGLAVVFCLSLSLWACYSQFSEPMRAMVELLLLTGTGVALIGFVDDLRGVRAGIRFGVHLLAAAVVATWFDSLPTMDLFSYRLEFHGVGFLIYILMVVWLINLYNFMDGIDGIAAVEAISVALCAAVISTFSANYETALVLGLLVLACGGFLIWNWPPARIFMGDVGSGYLGLFFAVVATYSALNENTNLWTWIILLEVFWIDATCTLVWRLLTGQKWSEAHRSHLYQIMARQWGSHARVTVWVMAINILWLFPWAAMTVLIPDWSVIFMLVSSLPLVGLAYLYGMKKA